MALQIQLKDTTQCSVGTGFILREAEMGWRFKKTTPNPIRKQQLKKLHKQIKKPHKSSLGRTKWILNVFPGI